MAFIPLMKAGPSSAITTLRGSTTGAAIDRYNVIRTFFKQQNATLASTSPQPKLPDWRMHRSTLQAARLVGFSSRRILSTTPHFHTRHFHATLLRRDKGTKPTPGGVPKNSPRAESDTRVEPHPLMQEPLALGEDPDLAPSPPDKSYLENYSSFFKQLALSLPHSHRPTRDDLLNVATNFWQRLRIRFKWFTIKSFRKFNADDISAFVTWFLMSQTLWILVGT